MAPDERHRFAREACRGDPSMLREVDVLLNSYPNAAGFLEKPAIGEVADTFVSIHKGFERGQRLRNYEILGRLGEGGMGDVCLARDSKLTRLVALKLLPLEFGGDPDALSRFEVEARTASNLNHPNIITIYEVGEFEDRHFIATEFIDGVTLRDLEKKRRLSLPEASDIAEQLASALVASHNAGIIHRDVKSANIMIRSDGILKLLDFGLAKEIRIPASGNPEHSLTSPGALLGTVSYMSPEQARGSEMDERTDIWSFGVVLYEVICGQLPFRGETAADVLAAILHDDPVPIDQIAPQTPIELRRIVAKSLTKEREARYQTARELFADLTRFRDEFELAERLGTNGDAAARVILSQPVERASRTGRGRLESFRTRPIGAILALMAVIAVSAAAYLYHFRSPSVPALSDKDTIIIADFDNRTGDKIFTGTLEQALAIALEQSPFLKIFPKAEIRETLKLMNRSPDGPVNVDVAREICERQGIKALVTGSIDRIANEYVISLEAIDGHTGEVIARQQSVADDNSQILKVLGEAANIMRAKLGESVRSIEDFDVPLQQATTSSLEAFQAFSMARELEVKGEYLKAIPYFELAIERDPAFAYPHFGLAVVYSNTSQPSLASEHAAKAYELRARTSKIEELSVESAYYMLVTGELDKAIETLQLVKRLYPRDDIAPLNLSDLYMRTGQWERVPDEINEIYRIKPRIVSSAVNENLGVALINLNRFDEAKASCRNAIEQKYDPTPFLTCLYNVAFVQGDEAAMQEQIDAARKNRLEYVSLNWRSQVAAFKGQFGRSRELSSEAAEAASRNGMKAVAAQYRADAALRDAAVGLCANVVSETRTALNAERNWLTLSRSALALSICGREREAKILSDDLLEQYPKSTLVGGIWLPAGKAALELSRNDPKSALESLESATRYEPASDFWTYFLRGFAHLKLNNGAEAAAEFRKILDHRGYAPLSVLYPLAQLGLARAAMLNGDNGSAQAALEEFRTVWSAADRELPVLTSVKKDFAPVK
jgi:serine/threonine protein kinase/tetratricopeptide (TPR) repeat protein